MEINPLAYEGDASSPQCSCSATRAWGERAECLVLVGQPYDLVVIDGSSLKTVHSNWNFHAVFGNSSFKVRLAG